MCLMGRPKQNMLNVGELAELEMKVVENWWKSE